MESVIGYRVAWVPEPGSPLSVEAAGLFGDDVVIEDRADPGHVALVQPAGADPDRPALMAALLSDRIPDRVEAQWMLESACHALAERVGPVILPRLDCVVAAGRVMLRPARTDARLAALLDRLALALDRVGEGRRRRARLARLADPAFPAAPDAPSSPPFAVALTGRLAPAALAERHRVLARRLAPALAVPHAMASLALLVDRGTGPACARHADGGMAMTGRIGFTGPPRRGRDGALAARGSSSLTTLGDRSEG